MCFTVTPRAAHCFAEAQWGREDCPRCDTAEAIVLLECYCIAREAHMVGMTTRVRLK